jgi:hypothetical protein
MSQQITSVARVKADFVTTIVTKTIIIANAGIEYLSGLETQNERFRQSVIATAL